MVCDEEVSEGVMDGRPAAGQSLLLRQEFQSVVVVKVKSGLDPLTFLVDIDNYPVPLETNGKFSSSSE